MVLVVGLVKTSVADFVEVLEGTADVEGPGRNWGTMKGEVPSCWMACSRATLYKADGS